MNFIYTHLNKSIIEYFINLGDLGERIRINSLILGLELDGTEGILFFIKNI